MYYICTASYRIAHNAQLFQTQSLKMFPKGFAERRRHKTSHFTEEVEMNSITPTVYHTRINREHGVNQIYVPTIR